MIPPLLLDVKPTHKVSGASVDILTYNFGKLIMYQIRVNL